METFLMILGLGLVFAVGGLVAIWMDRGSVLPLDPIPPAPNPRGLLIESINHNAREIEFVADRATADRLRRLGTVRPLWRDYHTGDTHWILYVSALANWPAAVDYVLPAETIVRRPKTAVTIYQERAL